MLLELRLGCQSGSKQPPLRVPTPLERCAHNGYFCSGTHGTDDVDGLGDRYQPAARALKALWDNGTPGGGVLRPVENAENSAAAATGKDSFSQY